MKIMTPSQYKNIFKWSAVWNLAIGVPQFLFPKYGHFLSFPFGSSTAPDDYKVWNLLKVKSATVASYGINYAQFARDPRAYRGSIWMGIILKLMTFSSYSKNYRNNQTNIVMLLITVGDVIWSILFGLFLWDTRNDEEYHIQERPW